MARARHLAGGGPGSPVSLSLGAAAAAARRRHAGPLLLRGLSRGSAAVWGGGRLASNWWGRVRSGVRVRGTPGWASGRCRWLAWLGRSPVPLESISVLDCDFGRAAGGVCHAGGDVPLTRWRPWRRPSAVFALVGRPAGAAVPVGGALGWPACGPARGPPPTPLPWPCEDAATGASCEALLGTAVSVRVCRIPGNAEAGAARGRLPAAGPAAAWAAGEPFCEGSPWSSGSCCWVPACAGAWAPQHPWGCGLL